MKLTRRDKKIIRLRRKKVKVQMKLNELELDKQVDKILERLHKQWSKK